MNIKRNNNHKTKLIIVVTLIIAFTCAVYLIYAYSTREWPFKLTESMSSTSDLPKVKSDNSQQDDGAEHELSSGESTIPLPTKTEGKTPAQYENEQADDTPAYNNEQFRIPENAL